MCIGFIKIAKSKDEKYKLIILNNRDEVLDRPTAPMHWHDGILSGVDEQDVARGTWLGINKSGKIGMLLSITQPGHTKHQNAPSRGGIVNGFLNTRGSSEEYFGDLKKEAESYNWFQFVGIERNPSTGLFQVKTLTNQLVEEIETVHWDDGTCHVFSNSPPHIPFKKTEYGQKIFADKMKNSDEMTVSEVFEKLLEVAKDRTSTFPDPRIQVQTGIPGDLYKPLTSIFVRFPESKRYGTRSHTLITVDQNDKVTVMESRMIAGPKVESSEWIDEKFEFQLEK